MTIAMTIAGALAGWVFPELCIVIGQGKTSVPVSMNIVTAYVGGISTYVWASWFFAV